MQTSETPAPPPYDPTPTPADIREAQTLARRVGVDIGRILHQHLADTGTVDGLALMVFATPGHPRLVSVVRGARLVIVRRLFEWADASNNPDTRASVLRITTEMEACGGVPLLVRASRTVVLLDASEVSPRSLVNAPGGRA